MQFGFIYSSYQKDKIKKCLNSIFECKLMHRMRSVNFKKIAKIVCLYILIICDITTLLKADTTLRKTSKFARDVGISGVSGAPDPSNFLEIT